MLPAGSECDSASLACSSFFSKRLSAVRWIRMSSAESGSMVEGGGPAGGTARGGRGASGAAAGSGSPGRTTKSENEAAWAGAGASFGAASSSRGASTGARSVVTTSRRGGASSGRSSAATAFASRFERWKNLGSTSSWVSGVRTFESSPMVEMHRR
ncbi:MAG TPA: hypothetical protein VF841_13705, partial [Anaeromyxobacter sp.]